MFQKLSLLSCVLLGACFSAPSAEKASSSSAQLELSSSAPKPSDSIFSLKQARQIIGIIPSWGAPGAIQSLKQGFRGTPAAQIFTRLNLQFWVLDESGNLTNDAPESTQELIELGKQNRIDLLLMAHNASSNGWDWDLVRKGIYPDHGTRIIQQMLAIVDSLHLAGVDLDFEGDASSSIPYDSIDQQNYVEFAQKLADSLHHRGKILSIDTYPNGNGAPKSTWWSNLKFADHIQAMTLENYWSTGPGDKNYLSILQNAQSKGIKTSSLAPILPLYMQAWSGSMVESGPTATENLRSFFNCMPSQAGIALFPITAIDEKSKWSDPLIWQTLAKLKNGQTGDTSLCHSSSPQWVIDDLQNSALNQAGGMWLGDTDFWIRLNQWTASQAIPIEKQIYKNEEDAWNKSTRLWNAGMDYDLAIQNKRWADFGQAYRTIDNLRMISAIFEPTSPIAADFPNMQIAFATLVMEFMPRNCDASPEACWEIEKTGQSRDLSSYQNIQVGLRCTKGKTLNVWLNSLDHPYDGYGLHHQCSGKWENLILDLDQLPALHLEQGKFEPSQAFRLNIGYENQGQKDSCAVDLVGVALNHNVLEWKGIQP